MDNFDQISPETISLIEANRVFLERLQDAHRDMATALLMGARFGAEPEPPDVIVVPKIAYFFHPQRPAPERKVEENDGQTFHTHGVLQVLSQVARHYGIPVIELVSHRRDHAVLLPRQIAMYLCHELTLKSYPDIARRMGGRDHTTVMHGVRKIKDRLDSGDHALRDVIDKISKKITSGGGNLRFDDDPLSDDARVAAI